MVGMFELKKDGSGRYLFNLKAANGQVILTSELYATQLSAIDDIAAVRKQAARDHNFVRKTSANDQHYFILEAANGQTLATSELYSLALAMEFSLDLVKGNAPDAIVVDLTE